MSEAEKERARIVRMVKRMRERFRNGEAAYGTPLHWANTGARLACAEIVARLSPKPKSRKR